jgi:hypothetical protein
MRTVYVVIKDNCVVEALADHLTDVVVIDLNTTDPQMLKVAKAKLEELKEDENVAECEIL